MNNKALTLSLFMAVVAVFFVQSYVSSIEEEAQKKFGTEVLVVVAKRDIREMETINETMLEFKRVPKTFLEPAAVSLDKSDKKEDEKENMRTLKGLAGSIAMVPIKKNEQLTNNKITDIGLRTGLAPQITPGKRAISMSVNEITGVAKLIKPGDRVDVICFFELTGKKENRIAKTVLQDVVVLAIGRNVNNNVARIVEPDPFGGKEKIRSLVEDFSFSSVTLELEPLSAQMLSLILSVGDTPPMLMLRNNDDIDRVMMSASTMGDILGADVQKAGGVAVKK